MIQQVLTPEEEQFLARERRCLADLLSAMARLEAGSEDETALKNALESLDHCFSWSLLVNSTPGRVR